jgi:hypothetical protein
MQGICCLGGPAICGETIALNLFSAFFFNLQHDFMAA